MTTLDPVASEARARSAVGRTYEPQGACLQHNYEWWGSVESTGPGHGHFATAIDGWNYSPQKHAGDRNPPNRVPIYFGSVAVPRWSGDTTYRDGDVGFSIGGGQGIFTDASGAVVGIMSIDERARETARPYLGWTGDFLGNTIPGIPLLGTASTGGETVLNPATPTVADSTTPEGISHMAVRQLLHEIKTVKPHDQSYLAVLDFTIVTVNSAQLAALKKSTGLPVTKVNEFDVEALTVVIKEDLAAFKSLVASA